MELGIREWMIIIGVLLLIAVLLDGIRKMRAERQNHIRVAFKMGGGVCDEDSYVDPVDREVSKPRVVAKPRKAAHAGAPHTAKKDETAAQKTASTGEAARIEPSIGEALDVEQLDSAMPIEEEPHSTAAAALDKAAPEPGPEVAEPPTALSEEKQETVAAKTKAKATTKTKTGAKTSVRELASARSQKQERKQLSGQSSNDGLSYDFAVETLAIYVLAKGEQGFNGADLLQVLLACDLRFGKQNIFHRHEYKNGTGPVQFSMANIMEPGMFDLNTIESFQTPGVCFFMRLPGPEDPLKAFDYMVETAKCIVRNLDGELKDEARSDMTAQTLAHFRQRVQEFERRQLTMTV